MSSPNENQTMVELILHHYPNSPFSEKIRLVFGMKGMAWQSVIVPAINPKPDVVAPGALLALLLSAAFARRARVKR